MPATPEIRTPNNVKARTESLVNSRDRNEGSQAFLKQVEANLQARNNNYVIVGRLRVTLLNKAEEFITKHPEFAKEFKELANPKKEDITPNNRFLGAAAAVSEQLLLKGKNHEIGVDDLLGRYSKLAATTILPSIADSTSCEIEKYQGKIAPNYPRHKEFIKGNRTTGAEGIITRSLNNAFGVQRKALDVMNMV